MSENEYTPCEEQLLTHPLDPNPFENEELEDTGEDQRPTHESDDPGHDYPDPDQDVERHPSSGKSASSTPRRPGTGSRQSPRTTDGEEAVIERIVPGEILLAEGSVTINAGREITRLHVINTADRPIQVGSHFHFYETNAGLEFDRDQAWGKRLNVLAGGAMRFEPGVEEDVELIPFRGDRIALGFRGRCKGPLDV